ncbi:MAG: glycine cleavage system aminomethyltransferase GcvT [Candidatus Aminicenantes bacterium]|nr:glycine cleavage system aminomethyltransferase GcvT [Candidatus Aminicenantes bacterium]MDH5384601.1 glycine cleavage system aminomethyltransferase GcvT [Candidatus Aminicenantes bacterium]MDH5743763.1 glycine cleavage system aminomethyltransferase GcvT [Candidatus Aminicenantes bacterium]
MKRTRLYSAHKELKAKFVEFFGWEMPIEYTGIIEEHLAVRQKAGLFDVSHMGEIVIFGPQALDFVQYLTPNNAARLNPEKAQYSALTTPQGTFVDDLLIYCLDEKTYLLVVNAANSDKDYQWILSHTEGFDVEVKNRSDDYTQLALQGPMALKILQPLTEIVLEDLSSFGVNSGSVAGVEVLVSRTGYTGEDGFEIYTLDENPEKIWFAILEQGEALGLLPIGLGARDTLRLEAKLMLYGNDIDETTTLLEADLGWLVKFKKGDFLGREVLLKQKEEGIRRKIVGFELIDRGVARDHYPVFIRGEKVSEVKSGSYSPFLQKSIGLTYLPVEHTEVGTELEIEIRGKHVKAKVIPTPFYKREN